MLPRTLSPVHTDADPASAASVREHSDRFAFRALPPDEDDDAECLVRIHDRYFDELPELDISTDFDPADADEDYRPLGGWGHPAQEE